MRRDVFQAIADPTRREILDLLARQPLNLNAVAENFPISRPAISRHLRILKECGLVKIRARGRERYCEANWKELLKVANWVDQYSQFWNRKMDALEDYLSNENQRKSTKK